MTNRTQILSSVDHFDFNWHINYVYADDAAPLLPAGTVLHLIGIHDNTSANRRNPDPNMWVGFGERSVDDMLQVWLNIVYLDDAEFQRLVDERKARPASTASVAEPLSAVGRVSTGRRHRVSRQRPAASRPARPREEDPAWIFPKGHIEPGETARATALRETLEEAGVQGEVIGGSASPSSSNGEAGGTACSTS